MRSAVKSQILLEPYDHPYPYRLALYPSLSLDAVVLALPHRVFREKEPEAYLALLKDEDGPGVLVDVKGVLPREAVENAGVVYWSM